MGAAHRSAGATLLRGPLVCAGMSRAAACGRRAAARVLLPRSRSCRPTQVLTRDARAGEARAGRFAPAPTPSRRSCTLIGHARRASSYAERVARERTHLHRAVPVTAPRPYTAPRFAIGQTGGGSLGGGTYPGFTEIPKAPHGANGTAKQKGLRRDAHPSKPRARHRATPTPSQTTQATGCSNPARSCRPTGRGGEAPSPPRRR